MIGEFDTTSELGKIEINEHSPGGPQKSTPQRVNPKDAIGRCKIDCSLVPATALIHEAYAMMDGAIFKEYGPYNWRDTKVLARVYIAACLRHVESWLNGEECAADSGAHHLGHARACLGIVIDAQEHGCLVDDRPNGDASVVSGLLERLKGKWMERMREKLGV
jgi:hypothetical protein